MADALFKVYLNNRPAPEELLDRIEEIVVEQEVDMATEARIKIPVTADKDGKWTEEDAAFLVPFSRVRIEVIVSDSGPVALVDGPIVGSEYNLASEPGKSSVTVVVHDDSAFLNREEKVARFDGMTDHEVVQQIFSSTAQIASFDIETTPNHDAPYPSIMQRGTDMELIRYLARRHGMHAYVLPGTSPGQSIGCFKAFPIRSSGIPPLIMLGQDRTLSTFNVRHDGRLPSKVRAFTLDLSGKADGESTAVYSDAERMGDEEALQNSSEVSVQLLSPYTDFSPSADSAVAGRAALYGFAFEARGTPNDVYSGILQPYSVVDVLGVNARLSGSYLIHSVTHILNRSSYSQQFTALRNARSGGSGSGGTAGAGGIF